MQVFYLHGFASSPKSSKAQFFNERLEERGIKFHIPDFNQPDFRSLTVSRMLQQLEKRIAAIPPRPVVLIGSSLGGFLAIEAAARQVNEARHPIDTRHSAGACCGARVGSMDRDRANAVASTHGERTARSRCSTTATTSRARCTLASTKTRSDTIAVCEASYHNRR